MCIRDRPKRADLFSLKTLHLLFDFISIKNIPAKRNGKTVKQTKVRLGSIKNIINITSKIVKRFGIKLTIL